MLDGQELHFVDEIKYLGVYILNGSFFKCSFVQCKLKFYRCFNSIYSKSKSSSSELICVNLLKSYCMPLVLYATEAIDLSVKDLKILDKLVNNAIGKIFGTYDLDIITTVKNYMNVSPIQKTVIERQTQFCNAYYKKTFTFLSTVYSLNSHVLDIL